MANKYRWRVAWREFEECEVEVEAETREEAEDKALDLYQTGELVDSFIEAEIINK